MLAINATASGLLLQVGRTVRWGVETAEVHSWQGNDRAKAWGTRGFVGWGPGRPTMRTEAYLPPPWW